VGWHLAAAAGRIGGRADGLQHHVGGRETQRQAQRAVAIVGEEPVVAGAHGQGRAHAQRFMAGAGDLEEDLLLALEQDLAVVHAAGKNHQPVDFDQLLRAQTAGAVNADTDSRALEAACSIPFTPQKSCLLCQKTFKPMQILKHYGENLTLERKAPLQLDCSNKRSARWIQAV
jgi:hypothetical protein